MVSRPVERTRLRALALFENAGFAVPYYSAFFRAGVCAYRQQKASAAVCAWSCNAATAYDMMVCPL